MQVSGRRRFGANLGNSVRGATDAIWTSAPVAPADGANRSTVPRDPSWQLVVFCLGARCSWSSPIVE